MRQVYLDYNSTTPLDERVLEVMLPYFREKYGNASSVHSYGREAKAALEEAREKTASLLGAEPSEIYFTSGGTESDNLALKGAAYHRRQSRSHIILSSVEHHAVLEAAHFLEKEGFEVDYLGVDREGFVSIEDLRDKISGRSSVVSVMHANNEVGTVQDIKEMAAVAHEAGALFHTDAVQAAGKIKIDVRDLDVDLLSISGHKIYGPKGIGALFIRRGIKITPLFHGGHHEKKRRPGTENVAGAVGLAAALEIAESVREREFKRLGELARYFMDEVMSRIPNVYLNGPRGGHKIPSTINMSFEFIEGESIILSLDLKGVAVSSGSACTSGSLEASHVLTAMSVPPELAQGSIRFSLGRHTDREDLEYALSVLPEIVERLRSMSPLYSRKQNAR